MKLLYFNPETEYALASGASFYTPPARVEKLRKENQLLPEAWADPSDIILVDCVVRERSDFKLVQWDMLERLFYDYPDLIIEPWGWNQALVRKLTDHGTPITKLPDASVISRIRELAHRRTTVLLTSLWNEMAESEFSVDVPVELKSVEEAMDFYGRNRGCWMKAPWSSSGRGVINTSADMNSLIVEQWCRGMIKRQGSVMGETGANKRADYATEWCMRNGQAEYIGLSSFATSNRGKYIANHTLSQLLMNEKFNSESGLKIERVVALQKYILEHVLTGYEGLFGVDMVIEHDGRLRPFVEVNLRRTMGMLHIIW